MPWRPAVTTPAAPVPSPLPGPVIERGRTHRARTGGPAGYEPGDGVRAGSTAGNEAVWQAWPTSQYPTNTQVLLT